jgi:hypothetical protein
VRAAAVLTTLLIAASMVGLVMFGFVWNDDPISSGLVFEAVALAAAATAVAALPSLLRGDRLAWLVGVGWLVTYDYWTVYKVFAEPEPESWPFLTVGLAALALLLTPSARAHVDAGSLR